MTERSHSAAEDAEALGVLRSIWTAQHQSSADIEPPRPRAKICKNMKNIGFGGLDLNGPDDLDSTAVPVGDELRNAWRDRLARDGKLQAGATTVRDLVDGDA